MNNSPSAILNSQYRKKDLNKTKYQVKFENQRTESNKNFKKMKKFEASLESLSSENNTIYSQSFKPLNTDNNINANTICIKKDLTIKNNFTNTSNSFSPTNKFFSTTSRNHDKLINREIIREFSGNNFATVASSNFNPSSHLSQSQSHKVNLKVDSSTVNKSVGVKFNEVRKENPYSTTKNKKNSFSTKSVVEDIKDNKDITNNLNNTNHISKISDHSPKRNYPNLYTQKIETNFNNFNSQLNTLNTLNVMNSMSINSFHTSREKGKIFNLTKSVEKHSQNVTDEVSYINSNHTQNRSILNQNVNSSNSNNMNNTNPNSSISPNRKPIGNFNKYYMVNTDSNSDSQKIVNCNKLFKEQSRSITNANENKKKKNSILKLSIEKAMIMNTSLHGQQGAKGETSIKQNFSNNQSNIYNNANIYIINNLFKQMPSSSRNINNNNTLFNSGLNTVIKNTVNLPLTPEIYQNNIFSSAGNSKICKSPSFKSNKTLSGLNTMNYFNTSCNLGMQSSASGRVQSYRNGSQFNTFNAMNTFYNQSSLRTFEKSDKFSLDMNSKEMKILVKIPFFINYIQFKNFTLWRNFSRVKRYQIKRDNLFLDLNRNILNINIPINIFEEYGKIIVNIDHISKKIKEIKKNRMENYDFFRLNNFIQLDNFRKVENEYKNTNISNKLDINILITILTFLSDFYRIFLDDIQKLSIQMINLFSNNNFVRIKNIYMEKTRLNLISVNNNYLGSPLLEASPKKTKDKKEHLKNQLNKFSNLCSSKIISPKNKIDNTSIKLQKNLSSKSFNQQNTDISKNVISTVIFYLLSVYMKINEKFFNYITNLIRYSKLEIIFSIENKINEHGINIFKIIQIPTKEEFFENIDTIVKKNWIENFYKAESIKFLIQNNSTENLPYLSIVNIFNKEINESIDSIFKYIENKYDHTNKKFTSLKETLLKNLEVFSKYSEIDFSGIFISDNLINVINEIQEFYKSFNIKFEDKYDFPNLIYYMIELKNLYKSFRNKFVNTIRNKIKDEVDKKLTNSINSSVLSINIQKFSSLPESEKITILLNVEREYCKILDDKKFFEIFCSTINEIFLKNKEDVLKSINEHFFKIKNLTENLETDLKKSIKLDEIQKNFIDYHKISQNILKNLGDFEILKLDDYNKLQELQNKINYILKHNLLPNKNRFLDNLNIYILITFSVEDYRINCNKLVYCISLCNRNLENLENLEKLLIENNEIFCSISSINSPSIFDLLHETINNFKFSENQINSTSKKLEDLLETNEIIYDILNIEYTSIKNLDERKLYLDKVKNLLQLILNLPKESEMAKYIKEKLLNLKSCSFAHKINEYPSLNEKKDNHDIINFIFNKIKTSNFCKFHLVTDELLIFLSKNLFNLLYTTKSHEDHYSFTSEFDQFYKIIQTFETKLLKKKVILTSLVGKNSNSNNLIYKDILTKESLHIHYQNLEVYTKLGKVFSLILEFSEILKEYIKNKKIILLVFDFKSENLNLDSTSALIDEKMLLNIIKVMLAFYTKIGEDSILEELKEFLCINMNQIVNLINLKNEFMRFVIEKYPKLFYLSVEDFSNFLILLFDFNFSYDSYNMEEKKSMCDKINYYYSKVNNYNITFEINNEIIVGINENWFYYLEFQNKINFNSRKDLLEYFNEVDNETRFTLKFDLINSLDNFSKINFFEWIFSQTNQIIICNLNLIFVNEVTQVLISSMELNAERSDQEIKKSEKQDRQDTKDKEKIKTKILQKNIKSELEILSNKLNSWIDLISKKISSFSRNNNYNNFNQNIFTNYSKNKCNIANFILTLQNQKNILENLINNKICDLENYEWLKYIRHIWDSLKKEIIVECGGWSTYQQYNFIGSFSRIIITPETDKIFLFTASCFREKSAAIVKVNSNSQGHLEIYKDFATNFWIDVISLDVSKDDENFSFTKRIFDVSTISKKWIFLENLENINFNTNSNIANCSNIGNLNSLVFLSKIMQIIQQEIILNEIKQSESQGGVNKIEMFCLMGVLKIENNLFSNSFPIGTPLQNIKNKEIVFKSSSRVLNLIKPDLRFFLNNVFIILGCNIKILPSLCYNILSNVEKLIQNKLPNFHFDFYLLNMMKNNLFKIFSANLNSCTSIGFSEIPIINSFNNLTSSSSKMNISWEIKGYLGILLETIYPLMKNLLFCDEEIFEMILNHVKGMLSATEQGEMNNLKEIFESLKNISLEKKISNFLNSNNKIYLESHIIIMANLVEIYEKNCMNSINENDNFLDYDRKNHPFCINKKNSMLPLVYGEPGVGKSSLICNTIEFLSCVMKKDLKFKKINELEITSDAKTSIYTSQLFEQFHLNNDKHSIIHLDIFDKNILNSLLPIFNNSNSNITSTQIRKNYLIIESPNIKNLSVSDISYFYLLAVQPLKYKKILKIFIYEVIQKLKQNTIIISDEYNLSIVEYITKLFSAISSDNNLSERFLYYKALELFNIMNLHLNIFIKYKNENSSKSILFNILVQSILIIFNNNVDSNFYEFEKGEKHQFKNIFNENEKIMKNVLKNIKNLTKSIIEPEICKELNVYLLNEFDFCLNLETFNFEKFEKIESIKNFGSNFLIYPSNYSSLEYLFKLSYFNKSNVIISGNKGCGKSTFINYCLYNLKNSNSSLRYEFLNVSESITKIFNLFSQSQISKESNIITNEKIIILDDLNIDDEFKDIICLNNYHSFLKNKNFITSMALFEVNLSEHIKSSSNGSKSKCNMFSCGSYEFFYNINKILFYMQDNSLVSLYKISIHNMTSNSSSETKKLYLNKFMEDYLKNYSLNLEMKDLKYLRNADFLLDDVFEKMGEVKLNNLITCSFFNSSFYEKFIEKEKIDNFQLFLKKFVNKIQDKKNNESDINDTIATSNEIIKFLNILESKIVNFVENSEYEILIILGQEIIFDILTNKISQKNRFTCKHVKFENSLKKLNKIKNRNIFLNNYNYNDDDDDDFEIFVCKIYNQEDLILACNNFEIESFIKSKKYEERFCSNRSRISINKKIIINFEDDKLFLEFSKTRIHKITECLTLNISNENLFTPGHLIMENIKCAYFNSNINFSNEKSSYAQKINIKDVRLNSIEELEFDFYFESLNKIRELRKNEEIVLQQIISENKNFLITNQIKSNEDKEKDIFNLQVFNQLKKPLKRLEDYLSAITSDEYESDLQMLVTGADGQQIIKIFENLFFNIYSYPLKLKFDFICFISNKFSLIILFKYFKNFNFEKILFFQEKINFNLFDEKFVLNKLKSESELGSILLDIFQELFKHNYNPHVDEKNLLGNSLSILIPNVKHNLPHVKFEHNIYPVILNPPMDISNLEILFLSFILISSHIKMKNDNCLLNYIAKFIPYEMSSKLNITYYDYNNKSSPEIRKLIFKIFKSLNYQILNSSYPSILLNQDTLATLRDIKNFIIFPLSRKENKNTKISILTLDFFENIYNFEMLLHLNLISKEEPKVYTMFKNSINNLYDDLPLICLSNLKNEKVNKNKNFISEILKVIQKPLSLYKKFLSNAEYINSDFFYLEQFREVLDENSYLKTKKDFYVNNLLEKIFLSINNKFLLAIFTTIEVMIYNNEMTFDESEFLIEIINENFEAGQDSSIKFKTPLLNTNKMSKKSLIYVKNLLQIYKKNNIGNTTELNNININNESSSINLNLSTNICEILEEIIKKVSKGVQIIDVNSYIKSLHRDTEKLLFYLIFLDDQSISFLKYLINKYLRPIYTIDHLKINQLLKKRSRFPFTIKSEPNINLTNFLCSLAAFYEIEFFIIREIRFIKFSNEENEIGYLYIIDNDTLSNILEALKNGFWLLITSKIDSKSFIKIFDLIQNNEKIIHENFKIFFDLNLIDKEDKQIKKLIENFTCILNVDSNSVDDLEAAHDIWVNVLDENILSGKIFNFYFKFIKPFYLLFLETIIEESNKEYLNLNTQCKNDISSISHNNNFIYDGLLEKMNKDDKSILNEIKDWKIISDDI